MIKAILLAVLLVASNDGHAQEPPSAHGSEHGLEVRLFKRLSAKTSVMTEAKARKELLGQRYQLMSLGLYHRLLANLRVGAFYWQERGIRWNEDWVKDSGAWAWSDTKSRNEHSLVLDATPGYEFALLDMTFEWKNRLVTNWSRGHHFLRTRPGLTYFFMKGDRPIANLFLQHEWYLPLDYGRHTVYERWLYLGTLLHVSEHVMLGPYFARRTRHWSHQDNFREQTGQGYFTASTSNFYGLTLNLVF